MPLGGHGGLQAGVRGPFHVRLLSDSSLSNRLSSVPTESPLSDSPLSAGVLRRPRRPRRRACGIGAAARLQPWRAANSRPRAFSSPCPAQPVGFRGGRRSGGGRAGGMGAAGAARRARDRDGPDPLLRALSCRLFLRRALRGGAGAIRGWNIRGWSICSIGGAGASVRYEGWSIPTPDSVRFQTTITYAGPSAAVSVAHRQSATRIGPAIDQYTCIHANACILHDFPRLADNEQYLKKV